MPCGRRRFSTLLISGFALTFMPELAWADADVQWQSYRSRFIRPDGRVVDTGNRDVSHSEGQGYGLLFAEHFDDQATFDSILTWTRKTLQCRPDRLHAWRFDPGAQPPVGDLNNATDGDLLIAMALARAARRWNRPELREQARSIYADVLRLATREVGGRLVLLPGVTGFVTPSGTEINLSYLIFPSLIEASSLGDQARWRRVVHDGVGLIDIARFGRWDLPPDWLRLNPPHAPVPAPGKPPRFSYDAVRIPLYLEWSGLLTAPLLNRFRTYWSAFGDGLPAWVDLATNARAPYPAPSGFHAVAECTGLVLPPGSMPAAFPSVASDPDYYSASLTLLARIVWTERHSP
nr:GluL [Lichenicola cladoniae]